MNSALLPLRALTEQEQVARVFRIAMHFTEYTDELAPVQLRHRASVNDFISNLETLLQRAQQAGSLCAHMRPHATAIGLFAVVDGLMRLWTLEPGSFDLVQVGEHSLTAMLAGLKTP
jgi:TetR/AcrR family acrAB operon transcriptional repressor